MSEQTTEEIDREVRSIIDGCYSRAKKLLEDNRDKLDLMAEALMQYETIDADQIDDIMAGHKPRPPKDWRDQGPGSSSGVKSGDGTGEQSGDDETGDDAIGGPANTH